MPFLTELTKEDSQAILSGLLELPAKFSFQTLKKVEDQFRAQGLLPPETPGDPFPAIPKE